MKPTINFTIILGIAAMLNAQSTKPIFKDVTAKIGLNQIKANKYWSPVIADFNRDGYYDLILANHGGNKMIDDVKYFSPDMYWGTANGFEPFEHDKNMMAGIPIGGSDYHGISAGYFGNKDEFPDFIITLGGANGGRGNLPVAVEFIGGKDNYIVRRDVKRKDALVDKSLLEIGIDGFGRGRSSFFIDADQDGDLDLVYNNKGPDPKKSTAQLITDSKFMYEWKNGKFNRVAEIGDMKNDEKERAAMADINHDGRLDLLYFEGKEDLACWISQGDGFNFKLDNSYLPKAINEISAIAEIDYDADGDFDLYLTRTGYSDGKDDILLEWDETARKYVDVSRSSGIIRGGTHQGVSVGDFDNNGYQDIFISVGKNNNSEGGNDEDRLERLPDVILMNNGDKTFNIIDKHSATIIAKGEQGDQSEVFDFDKDGKLDILSGSKWGLWRIFKNETYSNGNFALVNVGRSNSDKKLLPLGAVVIIKAKKGNDEHIVMRRVGSQGQSHAQSFIDTLHFGLGAFDTITEITVQYGTHAETTKFNRKKGEANKTFTVGEFFSNSK